MSQILIFLLSILFFTDCIADNKPNLNVSLVPDSGTNDTKFSIQVTVSGEDVSDFKSPIFTDNEYFKVAIQSNSIQEQIVNGITTQQKTFIFSLTSKGYLKEGDYSAPSGLVEYKNQQYRLPTKKIHIEAAKSFIGSALKAPDQDGFNFIQLLSNEKPYIGEQVSYRVEIIAPLNLLKAELEDFQVEGVWRERFGQDEKKQRQAYNLTIHSFSEAWFPIQSGHINVPERNLGVALQQMRRIPSGFGLSGQLLGNLLPLISQFSTEEKLITAAPISFEVLPLPPPPPGTFGHIPVGSIKVTSNIDKKDGKVGEPITLTVQVSGDANLKPLEIGKSLEPIKDNELRRYDEKPILKKVVNNPEIFFYKTFSITFIPLVNGNVKIPQFKIVWFDPKEKIYKSDVTAAAVVTVVGDPVLIPQREQINNNDLNIDAIRKQYSGTNIGIKPILALILFILSLGAPLLYSLCRYFNFISNAKRSSKKSNLDAILSNLKKLEGLPSIEALHILKRASSVFLKLDAIPLTGGEIKAQLETFNPNLTQFTPILEDLEKIIYSRHTVLTEDQKTSVANLVKAMHELA